MSEYRCSKCGKIIETTDGICSCYKLDTIGYGRQIINIYPTEQPKTPHRCPVCGGTGLVSKSHWESTSIVPRTCNACGGSGIVWSLG